MWLRINCLSRHPKIERDTWLSTSRVKKLHGAPPLSVLLDVMGRLQGIGAAMLVIGLLSACGANAEPVFPTVRPTATISPTPAPTQTVEATLTPTLVPATALPLPTLDATSSGPVSTALIGATSSSPAPATSTATKRAVQAGSLVIEYFTTTATSVRPGEKLTLFWSVRGSDSAIIYRLKPDGSKDFTWQVAEAGSLVVTTRKEDKDVTRFVLTVGDNITRIEQSLSVPLKCAADIWFFQPAPDACPLGQAVVTQAASQGFEHGQMIWLSGQGRIYVLFNDGRSRPGRRMRMISKMGCPTEMGHSIRRRDFRSRYEASGRYGAPKARCGIGWDGQLTLNNPMKARSKATVFRSLIPPCMYARRIRLSMRSAATAQAGS